MPIFRHFGQCQRQSKCKKTFWNTADRCWIIFRQALKTLPAQFLDPLLLWPMYCHFGLCRTQSGGRWENILKDCRHILDKFPASIVAKYTSGRNFTISWPIISVADVLPFWAVPDAIRRWENVLEHCRRLWDQFPASIVAKYTSSSNFTISWPIIFVADVLTFWAVPDAIRRWENVLKHCRCILDQFPASIVAKYLPAAISRSLDTLFLWPMYCHFGPCWRQSGAGKTFWKTANAFWLIFRQALLQNTLPAAFHDFLTHYFCGRCIAILGCVGRNPEVWKHSEWLPTHLG